MRRGMLRSAARAVGRGRGLCSAGALKPDEVVSALDKHIVGQSDAKVAVAIALRDQWRRQQLSGEVAREVVPNNILMVGPTGVGKTEVARRLAKLAGAPFIKAEATKFTEVGIYGADAESMIADLVDVAHKQAENRLREQQRPAARERAIAHLVKAIGWADSAERESLAARVRSGVEDDREVELDLPEAARGGAGFRAGGGGDLGGMGIALGMPKELVDALRSGALSPLPPGLAGGLGMGGRGGSVSFEVVGGGDPHSDSGRSGEGGDQTEGGDGGPKQRMRVGDALLRLEEAEMEDAMQGVDLNAQGTRAREDARAGGRESGHPVWRRLPQACSDRLLRSPASIACFGGSHGQKPTLARVPLPTPTLVCPGHAAPTPFALAAVSDAEARGIVFVDEIDKLVRRDGRSGGSGAGGGAFAKGEGVQKELLGLIEGTDVRTPRGRVSTAHILFVCAG